MDDFIGVVLINTVLMCSSSKKGKSKNLGFGGFEVAGHYAECYPG